MMAPPPFLPWDDACDGEEPWREDAPAEEPLALAPDEIGPWLWDESPEFRMWREAADESET